jgi:adenosylhomocysteine nucleosidase
VSPAGRVPRPLGIVTGIAAEAKIARLFARDVACSGGVPARAAEQARALTAAGVRALVSFGIAGGLAPDLVAGTLILADRVVTDDAQYPADAGWADLLRARTGCLYGGRTIAAGPAEKAILANRTGALAVDLESGPTAAVAASAGIPFIALRAIADPAWLTLPPAALLPLDAEGKPRLIAVLGSIAIRPAQIPGLIGIAFATRAALRSLLRAGRVLAV